MLDSLPPFLKHLLIGVVPVVLGVVTTDLIPQLQSINPVWGGLAAVVLQQVVLYFSKLTTDFGVGSSGEGDNWS